MWKNKAQLKMPQHSHVAFNAMDVTTAGTSYLNLIGTLTRTTNISPTKCLLPVWFSYTWGLQDMLLKPLTHQQVNKGNGPRTDRPLC